MQHLSEFEHTCGGTETAFVRFYRNDPVPTFKYTRWHVLRLSPQAAVLGLFTTPFIIPNARG